jgi:hypothetical protein
VACLNIEVGTGETLQGGAAAGGGCQKRARDTRTAGTVPKAACLNIWMHTVKTLQEDSAVQGGGGSEACRGQ